MGRLDGKRVLVTAAGQGIGRASALAMASEGAKVFATDVNEDLLVNLVADGIETFQLNVMDPDNIITGIDRAEPDVLFNCAGFVHTGSVLDATNDEWDFNKPLNVTGNAVFGGTISSGTSTITRNATAGNLITFNNSNGEIGSIETQGDEMVLMSVDRGLRIRTSAANSIIPVGTARTNLDDTVSLGSSAARFTTLYLSDNVFNWGKAGSATVFNEDGTTASV